MSWIELKEIFQYFLVQDSMTYVFFSHYDSSMAPNVTHTCTCTIMVYVWKVTNFTGCLLLVCNVGTSMAIVMKKTNFHCLWYEEACKIIFKARINVLVKSKCMIYYVLKYFQIPSALGVRLFKIHMAVRH